MSLLGAMIAWLVRGLLVRPTPALVRSAIGREVARAWRPECAWQSVAWRHASDGQAPFWKWSDPEVGRLTPGSCRSREQSRAFLQGVRRL